MEDQRSRRSILAGAAATLAMAASGNAASSSKARRTSLGLANDSVPTQRGLQTLEFFDLVERLGMGGAQVPLTTLDAAYAKQVRARLENSRLQWVLNASFNDMERFRRTVALAKEAGAASVRVASGGRRYEDFSTLGERQAHVKRVHERIRAAVPVVEAAKLPLGIENHKDFTLEEEVKLLKEYSSEYFGACVDTGNNLAILDDPYEVVEQLAPYAHSSHLKDATLEEYEDGFLLGDIPLGEGFLDLRRIVTTLHKAKPGLPLMLECITRNPLKIPCLTEKYWVTFPERNGVMLARAMRLVRANKPKWQMKVMPGMSTEARREMEIRHVETSIEHARGPLGLV